MPRFRLSISILMVAIVLLAAGFAALRTPTPLWANVWFSIAMGLLVLAIPAAVYRREEQRAFWVGFAACGWVYFVLTLAPWFQTEMGFQLVTTTILDVLSPYIVQKEYLLRTYLGAFNPSSDPVDRTPWQAWNLLEFPPENPWRMVGYVTLLCPGLYLRIGHCLFCVLVAFLGGQFVRFMAQARLQSQREEG
jgi:hypothetical protein